MGHPAVAVIRLAEMGGYQGMQGGVGEAVGQVAELAQAGKQGHNTGVAKAEARDTLAVNERRQYDLQKGVGTNSAAPEESLDVIGAKLGFSYLEHIIFS